MCTILASFFGNQKDRLMSATSAPVCFRIMPPRVRHGWLPYFLAAMGAGSALADEELLRYWWVLPDTPAVEQTPRVIRVMGDKGERFEEVYAAETRTDLKSLPEILRARLARQATLRRKAVQQARQLRESGKSPLVAYEEAWTRVFAENRLDAANLKITSWLEETLARLASGQKLTEDEVQWILEALLADDDRLEGEDGQELLRRLADYLRTLSYGAYDIPDVNDELMQRFAEAMRHMGEGVGAYRDALFKTHRDRIMFHSLTGYQAPWGAGMGRNLYYRQKPKQVGTTVSSGNTQLLLSPGVKPPFTAPGVNDLPGSVMDFLATSPSAKGEKAEEENDEEKEDEYQEQEERVTSSLPPLMNTFSLRAVNPVPMVVTEDETPEDGGSGREGVLRWDSTAGEPAVWDTEQTTAWVDGNGAETPYTAGGSVEFGNGADLNKSVQVADAGVVAGAVAITGSGYHFTGGDIKVTESLSVTGSAGFDGTLDVGANRITGGTLENVKLQVTGDIWRPVTQDIVTAHNLISSADGTHAAVLTDVQLNAGTATEYATLYNVAFAGDSTLTGYITIEKTQSQREIGVATGSTLTVDNATFDLRGMASGSKVLIVNGALDDTSVAFTLPAGMSGLRGELKGWDTVKFVYSGIAVNDAAVDTSVAGMVTLRDSHNGNLYWNGLDDDKWNPGSANWSSSETPEGQETFSALSNVYFGAGNAVNRDITVTQDMVVMNLDVTDGGYSFGGARVAVLGDASLRFDSGAVDFQNQLVVQGNLDAAGAGSLKLSNAATVAGNAVLNNFSTTIEGDMTVVGNLAVNAGLDSAAGSLTILGNVTAQEMDIRVHAGDSVSNDYDKERVTVSGNLTVGDGGTITIGGTAAQRYTGTVTAGKLVVKADEHDVYFSHIQADNLTVGEGAYVHVQAASDSVAVSSSSMPDIWLSGTLALDSYGTTYNRGYNVHVQSNEAKLFFGTGSTIDNLSIDGSAGLHDLEMLVYSRNATVTRMENLRDLTISYGSVTVNQATGAVHGNLTLDNARLNLGSDHFMAAGSGSVSLDNGARLNIGSTSQNVAAGNVISLGYGSAITGDASGGALHFDNGAQIVYNERDNAISASMELAQGNTLTISASRNRLINTLEISGALSGEGQVNLNGAGTVAFSGDNSFSGQITVGENSILSLHQANTLEDATVNLSSGGALALDAGDQASLHALTLNHGSILSISSITGTDDFSVDDVALKIDTVTIDQSGAVVLNVEFAKQLDTMTTYNLMTGVESIDNLSFNVVHEGVMLDASQYKLGLDPGSGLLYMYTMMGNVWSGADSSSWSSSGNGGNWSGGAYQETGVEYKDAIFRDLTGGSSTVVVQDTVSPGDVYFVADKTEYTLGCEADGRLAAGTNIHKDGSARVSLGLSNNATADYALGNMEVQAGTLNLTADLAVKGVVTVENDALLELTPLSTTYGSLLNEEPTYLQVLSSTGELGYTISNLKVKAGLAYFEKYAVASITGVTMDASGIYGTRDSRGVLEKVTIEKGDASLSYLTLSDTNIGVAYVNQGVSVELSNVVLTATDKGKSQTYGYYSLNGATIGENVVVDENGYYMLTGQLTFADTLVNKGKLFMSANTAEIGQIAYENTVDEQTGKSTYTYRFIQFGTDDMTEEEKKELFDDYSHTTFKSSQVLINGVNLATGLADGVAAEFVDKEDGSFEVSIGNGTPGSVDGTVGMPQWDERWGKKEKSPAMSRRYAGKDASANLVMVDGAEGKERYYMYDSIVNPENALKVNNGKAIVVTLSSAATGNLATAGCNVSGGKAAADHEVWIYDRSGFKTVIGGLANWSATPQAAATHVLINTDERWMSAQKELVIGGSRWGWQYGESFVTVENGNIKRLIGGSYEWVDQIGTVHLFVDGGEIGEIFAAGYNANLTGTQVVNDSLRAVKMVLTGGTLGWENGRVFGGGDKYTVKGDIYIRMEGSAEVRSQLVGGSNAGTVNGDIVLDLVSGKAHRVEAAGLGWEEWALPAYTNGNVQVNLYSDFQLGKTAVGGGLYGGKELSNYVFFGNGYTSTLNFAEAGVYELGSIAADGYSSCSIDSVTVTGFDRINLVEGAHAIVAMGMFDNDMDDVKPLEISGKGVVEVIGYGANFGRDIELSGGATLKISTSVIGAANDADDDRTITVLDGSTIDFSGFPVDTDYAGDSDYAGLGFKTIVCGDGINRKGAIYKGKYTDTFYPGYEEASKNIVNRISLPSVQLTGNTSVGVERAEYLFMNANELGATNLDLAGYTLAKIGEGSFITRAAQISAGTILVNEGVFGAGLQNSGMATDFVLSGAASLKLDTTHQSGESSLSIRSLCGAGNMELNNGTLTVRTTVDAKYYDAFMEEAGSYDQFMSTAGYAYAVYGGRISDGDMQGGVLVKEGDGSIYLTSSDSSYTGGTVLNGGCVYLLGTSEAKTFEKNSSIVSAGVLGTGAITWGSAGAELVLEHGARIYNTGTVNKTGGVMTIAVESAATGTLAEYIGLHSRPEKETGAINYVNMGGEDYVEIDTHSLKSIPVDAVYANGTAYKANTDIDRNLMLLVKATDWANHQNDKVTGFSDSGNNEATYSGVLRDSSADNTPLVASLLKTGLGTLVLDQVNTYTGGTEVAEGTLRLRGWGTVGSEDVVVNDGASLMLAYTLGYGDAETVLDNDISLGGSGDEQWLNHTASEDGPHALTDGRTAALISAVGQSATVVLNGDITDADESVSGGVLHSGDGTLVLGGDSSYSGGTHISRGVVEVQSASGLGATASGRSEVVLESAADLRVTVKPDYEEARLVTTLAAAGDDIHGDVIIEGTGTTERVLRMEGNGYNAASTFLGTNGTFLLSGNGEAGISSQSKVLAGTGAVVVSDASGQGTVASFDSMVDYTGDFRVEGDKTAIQVNTGSFIDGSIHVAGQQASVNIGGNVSIAAGESLHLRSTGVVPALAEGGTPSYGTGAALISDGAVSVAAGATLSVQSAETDYLYNMNNLEKADSLTPEKVGLSSASQIPGAYHPVGDDTLVYQEQFNAELAINLQAAGAMNAAGGITLAGGSTYEINQAHISLMGGSLTLDTMEHHPITLNATLEESADAMYNGAQLVLFSDVSGVTFRYGVDWVTATAGSGVYYTQADLYMAGSDYVDSETMLVYDSEAGVVYLQWVPQQVPEPATTTLSLLALTALLARRRRV